MDDRYTFADKSLTELLADLDSDLIAAKRAAAYPILANTIAIKVAIANERAAEVTAQWARVAAFASVASVIVALAAVLVAALSG